MRPLIGIPPCLDEGGRWKAGREVHYIDAAYARAIATAGGTPIYLPCLPLQEGAEALVQRIDGLLLPGGGDFPPERPYPADVVFDPVPERQLAFDRALLDAALEGGTSVLAICYGMQLLALAGGGTLHHDVATDVPGAGPHRLPEPEGRHALRITPGTRLAAILGDDAGPVNSRHHQAVAEPGADARVCAVAGDGLIEAIELADERFAIGVQWHPEGMPGAFVAACPGAARDEKA
jgi:putative glutamine amidotransferase